MEIDFEDSNSFDAAKIVAGKLQEMSYEENFSEPEFARYGKHGNCPDCGTALDDDNDGGNGFYVNWAPYSFRDTLLQGQLFHTAEGFSF